MSKRYPEGDGSSPFLGMQQRQFSALARPQSPWPMVLGVLGIALLAVAVFASLSSSRASRSQPRAVTTNSALAPGGAVAMLGAPGNVLMPPAVTQASLTAPEALASGSTPALTGGTVEKGPDRMAAPSVVIDLTGAQAAPGTGSRTPTGEKGQQGPAQSERNENSDERFAARIASSAVETVLPTPLRDRALVAPQGTIVPAVMETAINSDLPGYVRAIVSRDVRGFDGSTVLIPRGTHLIGQYRNAVAVGQSRAFVVWSRMLTPDGLSIDIQSPGSDRLGRSGLEGETHSHFFRRFGNAILLSVLNAGLQAAANAGSNNSSIIIGSSQQASNIASLALQKEIDIPPTVTVDQGSAINIFIARDLDFSRVRDRNGR